MRDVDSVNQGFDRRKFASKQAFLASNDMRSRHCIEALGSTIAHDSFISDDRFGK